MRLYLLCYPESEFSRGVNVESDGIQLVEVTNPLYFSIQ